MALPSAMVSTRTGVDIPPSAVVMPTKSPALTISGARLSTWTRTEPDTSTISDRCASPLRSSLDLSAMGRPILASATSCPVVARESNGFACSSRTSIFKQTVRDGWQHEQPDHWLARPDPWEVPRPDEAVQVRLGCSFDIHAGALRTVQGRPSTLIGIPYDRPVVGYGGRTINTLRLWSAATPDYFDFQQFSGGDFVGALAETLTAETLTRVLYPDDSTTEGRGLRFLQQYFLVACTLADAIRRFRAAGNDWPALPDKVAMQLNDTHPTLAVPEVMRILLDEAKLGWDPAVDLNPR